MTIKNNSQRFPLKTRERRDLQVLINKDFIEGDSFDLLTIAEVASKLKLKDNDSAIKWLKKQGISIHKIPKNVVYKIEVDCAISKPLLVDLKIKYPANWNSIFRGICNNVALYEMVVSQVGDPIVLRPTTKVLPRNNKEKELLKRLTQ